MLGKGYFKLLKNTYKREINRVDDFISKEVEAASKKKQSKKNVEEEVRVIREESFEMVRTSLWMCPVEIFQTRKYWRHIKA